MIAPELLSLIGGGAAGFLFRYMAQKAQDQKEMFQQMMAANKQSVARRGAYRLIAIGSLEEHSLLCESVHRWCLCKRISVASDSWFEIVDADQKYVGTSGPFL